MKRMQKGLTFLILAAILCCLMAIPVSAAEDAITSVDVQVNLQSGGSAVITEIWDVRGASEGTEYYKALENMEGMAVHSLAVQDETGQTYQVLENWDTDRSLEEKAGTCGILKTGKGYELCWGMGSYGDHRYTIRYTLDGLVKDYGDSVGFYHEFVGELSSAPQAASVTITAEGMLLSEDNARVWAYGFTGETKIGTAGALRAHTLESMDSGDYIRLLCRFDRELFPGVASGGETFEELKNRADNDNSDLVLFIVLGAIFLLVVFVVILSVYFYSRFKLSDGTTVRLPKAKDIEPLYSVPLGGSLTAVYAAMKMLRRMVPAEKLMGAYLIRLQEKGQICIEEREAPFQRGRKAKQEVIVLNAGQAERTASEQRLMRMLSEFAGQDGILWSSAIEEHAESLHHRLLDWAKQVGAEGEQELIQGNIVVKDAKNTLRFTPSGFPKATAILGFQKYLREMQKGDAGPRELWGDYLVFAAMFSMGKQVLESMEALDPAYYSSFTGMYGYNTYSMLYFISMTDHITSHTVPQSSDGTGGASSSSGGGGFSGGGGGGSR